ncbi:hypothetical protein EZJ43_11055 [Pedobacter changchengzhani]|uniref:Uncharacterized protein n=1 Tax=Pedobacter changchengzhani TaxID=2529274 RepID=A0A4R5MKF3_9SPHI|nr:hypothetical protein [Pedobacter changchengzhani]TDG35886.1 hypothetical protein EZJ43_11055 [Pedobacter changchengzhani]
MSYTYTDINEDAVYALKKDNLGNFYTEYIPIEKALLNEIDVESFYQTLDDKTYGELNARDRVEKQQQSIIEFYSKISLNYSYLYRNRSYCLYLSSQYGGFFNITVNTQITLYQNHTNYNFPILVELPRDANGASRVYGAKNFKNYTETFLQSYFLQTTYEKFIHEAEIKVISHRFNGWKNFWYTLDDTLSVEIATNFGFGSASYFTVTLIFKGIKIIPYSRLVIYRNADFLQILRNTREYACENESWALALDFIRDASNGFQEGGNDEFIKKYVINECENLVNSLERCLYDNMIEESDNLFGYFISFKPEKLHEIHLEGFLQMVVKAEKISGATNFIDSIYSWCDFVPTQEYIDRIDNCCLVVYPELLECIDEINIFLSLKQIELENSCKKRDQIKVEVDDLLEKTNFYQNTLPSIRIEIYNNYVEAKKLHTISNEDLDNLALKEIKQRYPKLTGIEEKFEKMLIKLEESREKCDNLNQNLSTHQDYLSSMTLSKQSIENYLKIYG